MFGIFDIRFGSASVQQNAGLNATIISTIFAAHFSNYIDLAYSPTEETVKHVHRKIGMCADRMEYRDIFILTYI